MINCNFDFLTNRDIIISMLNLSWSALEISMLLRKLAMNFLHHIFSFILNDEAVIKISMLRLLSFVRVSIKHIMHEAFVSRCRQEQLFKSRKHAH